MSDLFSAYLAGTARELYAGSFREPGDRRRAVERATRPLAAPVADAIARQNARHAPSEARDAHLAALGRGAAAVVTGQQVGLFLGPLFTVYKAASAVAAARALRAETGMPVVPIFWLQTEDHDLAEIAAFHLPGGDSAPRALRLPASEDHRVSIAHCTLPPAVADCLEALAAELGALPAAASHLERLARHYRPGNRWADAFAGVLAELFADAGLVVVDPRDPVLAAATSHVHRQALERAGEMSTALLDRAGALAAAGFASPVHVRPGSPLSFFHPDGAEGPRRRLLPAADGFAEAGGAGVHSLDSLLDALAGDPLRFSTSALLRPIVQDVLLPTAAYVGGPAEVAYFAQIAPLYAAFDLPMPIVIPRARFAVVEPGAARALRRLGLAPDDLHHGEDALLARIAARGRSDGCEERIDPVPALLAPFDAALGELRAALEQAGPGMASAIAKTRATVETAITRLAARYEKARSHRDHEVVLEVRRLKALLYPGDAPQERVYGLAWFAARVGERALLDAIDAAIDPFDPAPRVLAPEAAAIHAGAKP